MSRSQIDLNADGELREDVPVAVTEPNPVQKLKPSVSINIARRERVFGQQDESGGGVFVFIIAMTALTLPVLCAVMFALFLWILGDLNACFLCPY
ncbi:MAG: hypothetical protein AAFU54_25345 [Chloroflexota bacterium]